MRHHHRADAPVRLEHQSINRDLPMFADIVAQRPAMIGDEPVVGARDVEHRMMTRPARDLEILRQYLAARGEGPGRGGARRISDAIVGAGPAALGPHEIIDALAFDQETALDIAGRGDFLVGGAIGEGFDPSQIGAQPYDVAMFPAAIEEVNLPVFVAIGEGVDRLSAIVKGTDQRLADRIAERAARVVADRQAYAAYLTVALNIICLLYTSPSPRDMRRSRMPSSA